MYVYRYAASVGVKLMTFDTAFELQKIAQLYPSTGESAFGLCCPSGGNLSCSRNFLRKIPGASSAALPGNVLDAP